MNEPERLPERCRNAPADRSVAADNAEKRAVLISERHAVLARPAPIEEAEAIDPVAAIADPIWDHRNGTTWTPDLVHCRLLGMADTLGRLPGASLRRYQSLLGKVADHDPEASRVIVAPPSPTEITMADWTCREILKRPHELRQLLLGMAFEQGVRKIGRKLGISKSEVSRDYMAERRYLAGHWQGRRTELLARVDELTFGRWVGLFQNARK
jgi:hypothetical protein